MEVYRVKVEIETWWVLEAEKQSRTKQSKKKAGNLLRSYQMVILLLMIIKERCKHTSKTSWQLWFHLVRSQALLILTEEIINEEKIEWVGDFRIVSRNRY